jgi:hypothetical protein
MARDKGARGEREVIDLLQPIVDTAYHAAGLEPPQLKRTSSMQADGGGCDVHGLPWLALEVKRQEALLPEAWYRQCVQQATRDQLPVLIYRQSKHPWRVRLLVQIAVTNTLVVADISIGDFLSYFAEVLALSLRSNHANL